MSPYVSRIAYVDGFFSFRQIDGQRDSATRGNVTFEERNTRRI